MRTTTLLDLGLIGSLACAGCAVSQRDRGDPGPSLREPTEIHVHNQPEDAAIVETVRLDAIDGVSWIESFFDQPFGEPIAVRLMPDRAAFDTYTRANWGFPKTECWMVGAGETAGLLLLSPRVWSDEACDHDPADAEEVRRLIVHELCHTYHMRINPSDEFDGVTTLDWFVEGLAVYVSGQLDEDRRAPAAEALRRGDGPARLGDTWTGPNRYGFSGAMVAIIDQRWGRETLTSLLGATSQEQLLDTLGVSEEEFLKLWREAAPW